MLENMGFGRCFSAMCQVRCCGCEDNARARRSAGIDGGYDVLRLAVLRCSRSPGQRRFFGRSSVSSRTGGGSLALTRLALSPSIASVTLTAIPGCNAVTSGLLSRT